jgi:hypothetical protein
VQPAKSRYRYADDNDIRNLKARSGDRGLSIRDPVHNFKRILKEPLKALRDETVIFN